MLPTYVIVIINVNIRIIIIIIKLITNGNILINKIKKTSMPVEAYSIDQMRP